MFVFGYNDKIYTRSKYPNFELISDNINYLGFFSNVKDLESIYITLDENTNISSDNGAFIFSNYKTDNVNVTAFNSALSGQNGNVIPTTQTNILVDRVYTYQTNVNKLLKNYVFVEDTASDTSYLVFGDTLTYNNNQYFIFSFEYLPSYQNSIANNILKIAETSTETQNFSIFDSQQVYENFGNTYSVKGNTYENNKVIDGRELDINEKLKIEINSIRSTQLPILTTGYFEGLEYGFNEDIKGHESTIMEMFDSNLDDYNGLNLRNYYTFGNLMPWRKYRDHIDLQTTLWKNLPVNYLKDLHYTSIFKNGINWQYAYDYAHPTRAIQRGIIDINFGLTVDYNNVQSQIISSFIAGRRGNYMQDNNGDKTGLYIDTLYRLVNNSTFNMKKPLERLINQNYLPNTYINTSLYMPYTNYQLKPLPNKTFEYDVKQDIILATSFSSNSIEQANVNLIGFNLEEINSSQNVAPNGQKITEIIENMPDIPFLTGTISTVLLGIITVAIFVKLFHFVS